MKKKIFCMVLSLLSVIVALSACGQATTSSTTVASSNPVTSTTAVATTTTTKATTATVPTTSKVPTTDEPQYGGTLTIFPYQGQIIWVKISPLYRAEMLPHKLSCHG